MKATKQHYRESYPQLLADAGERRPEHIREAEELDAARAWLRHVEAGRIGTRSHAGVHGEHDDARLG